jgi:Flp pilus assembly protein CpaB
MRPRDRPAPPLRIAGYSSQYSPRLFPEPLFALAEGIFVRRSPRALAAWAAAVVVALVTANVVATDLATLHRRAASLGPRQAAVVAATDLPLGATVRAADLKLVTMYASTIPHGAMQRRSDAVGRVVAVPVLRDAILSTRHLTAARRNGLDGLVPDGSRAVRIPTDDGLRPERGDVVDVLVSLDPSLVARAGGGEGSVTIAHAARVLVGDSHGVTLLVTEQEAHAIAFSVANGTLMLALAPPEAACCNRPTSTARGR